MQSQDLPTFDYPALVAALNDTRSALGLTWMTAADALWQQSSELNDQLGDHRFCGGALARQGTRAAASCQYALALLRWLDRAPEEFLVGTLRVSCKALPGAGLDQRLRWDLAELYEAVDLRRRECSLTWTALAQVIGGPPSRLANLRTARQADMNLVMRLTQWLA